MTESKNWDWKKCVNNFFHYTDENFLRYFCGDKNENESKKTELLAEKLKECIEKIHSFGLITDTVSSETSLCLQLGYTENYGYYALEDNGRGHYSVPYGLPSENIDTAVMMIIRRIIWFCSLEFERINRSELKKDYESRFNEYGFLYEGCLYYAEYCLSVWKILFDNVIPKEVIEYYETCMNDISSLIKITSYIWKYNSEGYKFELVAKN